MKKNSDDILDTILYVGGPILLACIIGAAVAAMFAANA